MSIEIVPTGAALGAEIRGVDLARPIDEGTFGQIERAFNENGVIFFRDQRITPPQQVELTRRFGEIGQPGDRRGVECDRGRQADRRPSRRRKLA